MWTSFVDELQKIATVSRGMKMYRRALQTLLEGSRAFHGVEEVPETVFSPAAERLRSIIADAKLLPSRAGKMGPGVYHWKDRPLNVYMRSPEAMGVSFPRVPGTPEVEPGVLLSPSAIPLPGTKTTVYAPSDVLRKMKDVLKEKRFRQSDSAIFHRAEADMRAKSLAKSNQFAIEPHQVSPPTEKELADILKGRRPAPYPKMRSVREEDVETFLENYLARRPNLSSRSMPGTERAAASMSL